MISAGEFNFNQCVAQTGDRMLCTQLEVAEELIGQSKKPDQVASNNTGISSFEVTIIEVQTIGADSESRVINNSNWKNEASEKEASTYGVLDFISDLVFMSPTYRIFKYSFDMVKEAWLKLENHTTLPIKSIDPESM